MLPLTCKKKISNPIKVRAYKYCYLPNNIYKPLGHIFTSLFTFGLDRYDLYKRYLHYSSTQKKLYEHTTVVGKQFTNCSVYETV